MKWIIEYVEGMKNDICRVRLNADIIQKIITTIPITLNPDISYIILTMS